MSQIELLNADQISDFLCDAAQNRIGGTLSCLLSGKWRVFDCSLIAVSKSDIQVRITSNTSPGLALKTEQPVGLCLQQEYDKFIFDSTILDSSDPNGDGTLSLEIPDKIEKMQRRAYERSPIPAGLNVRAMFWHRGHLTEDCTIPHEHYWQGRLENLSAGGAMIRVGTEISDCFSIGQLVGVQFTPMSYQKPLLLDAHVRHLKLLAEGQGLQVGVEFLGLEASPEGREILHRLIDVVETYEQMNQTKSPDHSAGA